MPSNDKVICFTMRLPSELHAEIKRIADMNKRSVAKQIEFMIEQSLQSEHPKDISSQNH